MTTCRPLYTFDKYMAIYLLHKNKKGTEKLRVQLFHQAMHPWVKQYETIHKEKMAHSFTKYYVQWCIKLPVS